MADAEKPLEHIRAVATRDNGINADARKLFTNAMESDLNTPMALAAIQTLASSGDIQALRDYGEILGINFLREASIPVTILQDIRSELRARKQFELADIIRDRMVAAGITITDPPLR